MNQKQIVNAYFTLVRLSSAQLPVKTAYALYQLRKKLEPTYTFCLEQERLIIDRFHGVHEGAAITFESAEAAQQAQHELDALNAMEVQLDFSPVVVRAEDTSGTMLSMNDIETLDGFVAFA